MTEDGTLEVGLFLYDIPPARRTSLADIRQSLKQSVTGLKNVFRRDSQAQLQEFINARNQPIEVFQGLTTNATILDPGDPEAGVKVIDLEYTPIPDPTPPKSSSSRQGSHPPDISPRHLQCRFRNGILTYIQPILPGEEHDAPARCHTTGELLHTEPGAFSERVDEEIMSFKTVLIK